MAVNKRRKEGELERKKLKRRAGLLIRTGGGSLGYRQTLSAPRIAPRLFINVDLPMWIFPSFPKAPGLHPGKQSATL